jgi:hypothetical protein
MSESSKDKTKQTTMGTFFTTHTKTKDMSDKEKEEVTPKEFNDRVLSVSNFHFV